MMPEWDRLRLIMFIAWCSILVIDKLSNRDILLDLIMAVASGASFVLADRIRERRKAKQNENQSSNLPPSK